MARRKKQPVNGDKPAEKFGGGFGDYQFVRHTMTRDEMERFKQWEVPHDVLWGVVDGLADNGYKLSISFDDYNHAMTASLTCRSKVDANAGLILTARAAAAYDAVLMLVFKHEELLGRDWTAFRPGGEGEVNYG